MYSGGVKTPTTFGSSGSMIGPGGTYFGTNLSASSCSMRSTGSTVWDSTNASSPTVTGSATLLSSAILKAWRTMSWTSWLLSQNTWIQPESLSGMISLCSTQMLIGAAMALLTTAITTGSLIPDAIGSSSCIRARPWDDVAVKVRTPVALADMHVLIAGGWLSPSTYSQSISPLLTNSEMCSTMNVCGVIGYAATNATLDLIAPYAAA